jgi:hypothetical protein
MPHASVEEGATIIIAKLLCLERWPERQERRARENTRGSAQSDAMLYPVSCCIFTLQRPFHSTINQIE